MRIVINRSKQELKSIRDFKKRMSKISSNDEEFKKLSYNKQNVILQRERLYGK